jgi:hypothetical protein
MKPDDALGLIGDAQPEQVGKKAAALILDELRRSKQAPNLWDRSKTNPGEWTKQRAQFPSPEKEGFRNWNVTNNYLAEVHDRLAKQPDSNPLWADLHALWEICRVAMDENLELRQRCGRLYDAFVDQAFRQWHAATSKSTYRY